MYHSTLGQQSSTSVQLKGEVPDWAAGTAAIIKSASEPALQAYSMHMRNELNKERVKAGLPPLLPREAMGPPAPPPPPKPPAPPSETFTIGGIALVAIIILMFMGKPKPKSKAKPQSKKSKPKLTSLAKPKPKSIGVITAEKLADMDKAEAMRRQRKKKRRK